MKKLFALCGVSLAALTLSACTDSPTSLPPGHYESKTSSVDANDTGHSRETSTDVYYDANGNKKATVNQKTTTDPKGLFNKSTSESTETVQ